MREKILHILDEAVAQQVFPGAAMGWIIDGRIEVLVAGRLTYENKAEVTPETVYDIASVTKSIPVGCLILKLIEEGALQLEDKAITFLPEMQNDYRDFVRIQHLLTYTVVWQLPVGLSQIAKDDPNAVMKTLFTSPFVAPPGEMYHYTNAPAVSLGLIAERVTNKTLDVLADEYFFTPLDMRSTTFHPERLNAAVAPTEIDFRGEVHKLVHDETAWALRGAGMIAGNAGLFSNVKDLLVFAEMLLHGGVYKNKRYFSEATIKMMYTNQTASLGKNVGLGWELQQPHFMGTNPMPTMFGKTGFTGSSIVIDPLRQRALVLLTNRTYPKRKENRVGMNYVRRQLTDIVFV